MNIKPAITYNPKTMTGKEWIDYAASNGFSCMEIAAHHLPDDAEGQDELIPYAKSKGFSLSIHSPFGKNNIADTDEENRKKMHFPLTAQDGMVDLQSVCEVLKLYDYHSFVVLETEEPYLESKQILEAAMAKL